MGDSKHSVFFAVRQVISVDFGSGTRMDWPDSIHARLVHRDRNNGRNGKGLEETASYVNQNSPDEERWSSNPANYDQTIQSGEAYDIWRRLGYGWVITGSVKEKKFLNQCEIHCVIVMDEGHLLEHLEATYATDGLRYQMENLESNYDLVNLCTNSYFRSWRLARLVEDYQKHFFKNFPAQETRMKCTSNCAFGEK